MLCWLALFLSLFGLLSLGGVAQADHFPPEVEFLNGTEPDGAESCLQVNVAGELKQFLCENFYDRQARTGYRVVRDPVSRIILWVIRLRVHNQIPEVVYRAPSTTVIMGQP